MAKKRVTRKQLLKEPDEFITTTGKLIQWAKDHTNQLIISGAILLVAVLFIAGLRYYNERQKQSASALYGKILAAYQSEGGEKEAQKALAAISEDLTRLIETYGHQPAGRMGRVMAGHFNLASRAPEQAVAYYLAALDDFSDNPSVSNIIHHGLGLAYIQLGQYPAAIEQFQALSLSSSLVLKDAALFHLGYLYNAMGQAEESRKAYEQLRNDFPETTYAKLVLDKP